MLSLRALLNYMLGQNYSDASFRESPENICAISDRCCELISRDYDVQTFSNSDGSLCSHYPPSIFIPKSEQACSSELISLIYKAKYARGRSRFVVPALSFRDKFICRSSTLSGSLELYGRQVASAAGLSFDSSLPYNNEAGINMEDDRSTLNRVRDDDCELMKRFRIHYICDFMLEYRKIKYWLPVTSSEKADNHDRYSDFVILALPYPGSEFFRVWKDSGYLMRGLMFDWNQPLIEVQLQPDSIPKTLLSSHIDWSLYKSWDATNLTVNYLKLLLGLLFEGAGGLLLHCVSGWDRTPLFISLIRCLLWADDLAHRSLQPEEMLYYTLAYDWFLFGHQLRRRMDLGEEVLYFAFRLLAEIAADPSLSIRNVYDMVLPPEKWTPESNRHAVDFVELPTPFSEVQWSSSLLQLRQYKLEQLTALFFQAWISATDKSLPPTVTEPSGVTNNTAWFSDSSNPKQLSISSETKDTIRSDVITQVSDVVSSVAHTIVAGLRRTPTEDENCTDVNCTDSECVHEKQLNTTQ